MRDGVFTSCYFRN